MTVPHLLQLRLQHQGIAHPQFMNVEERITWLGAMQAQDYTAAKWALGLRCPTVPDEQIEQAFTEGKILRTHVMRPTWHFVTPKDIRWMLKLTAPHVHKINSYYYRQLGLDEKILQRSIHTLKNVLKNNRYLTREELAVELERAGILTSDKNLKIGYMLIHAELEGIICSGPLRGKQFTYALLDERVKPTKNLAREEALKELAIRYFQSHGPATLQDFIWWSGFPTSEAKKGIALADSKLSQEKIEDVTYWFINQNVSSKNTPHISLLPNFDEYIVGYKNRQFIFNQEHTIKLDARANPLFQHTIIKDGKVIGTWKREFKKNLIVLNTNIFESLSNSEEQLLVAAIHRFSIFANKPVTIERA